MSGELSSPHTLLFTSSQELDCVISTVEARNKWLHVSCKMTCHVCRRVNWRPAKASAVLKPGDVVSCAGKGRLEVGEVSETKKGKHAVELARRV